MGSGFCYCKKTLCKETTDQQQTNEVNVFEKLDDKEDNSKKINIIKVEFENSSIPNVKEEKNNGLKSKNLLGLPPKQNFKMKENNNEIIEPIENVKMYKSSQNIIRIDDHLKLPVNSENNGSLNFNSINGSEYSQSIMEPSTKFIRKNYKSSTGLDKIFLNKKLKIAEKNLAVSTESLIVHQKGDFNLDYQIIKNRKRAFRSSV